MTVNKNLQRPGDLQYPFYPKSNKLLVEGHFWSIPLINGEFGCGRVIGLNREARHGSQVTLVAGLAGWRDLRPPTEESISTCAGLIEFGQMHVNNFQILDMPVTGWATTSGLEIPEWWHNGWLVRGSNRVRMEKNSNDAENLTSWSIGAIWVLAHIRLLKLEPSLVDAEFRARFSSQV